MLLIIDIKANLEIVEGVLSCSKLFAIIRKQLLTIAYNRIHNSKAVELINDYPDIELTLDLALHMRNRHEASGVRYET